VGKLVFLDRSAFVVEKKAINDVVGEIQRFHAARQSAAEQLDALASDMKEKLGEEHALLFEVHHMMLEDSEFVDPIIKIIETELLCAEYAVETASALLAKVFADMDDEYMSARAVDVRDIARRIIAVLSGTQRDVSSGDDPVILASDDFTPSETAQFDRTKVLALVSQAGAANSHTAIFARTMGIPAIIELSASLSAGLANKDAAIDGGTGVLYIEATPETLAALAEKQQCLAEERRLLDAFRGKPTLSKDGRAIKLLTKTFIDMGIDELSIEPSYILNLRHCIAQSQKASKSRAVNSERG
jgi:phosphotransferase system enzyme I (PtsI)